MEKRIEKLLSQMTVEEKITLLSGSSVLKTAPIPRVGIHELEMADGPQGVREKSPGHPDTTALPCGVALAAAFDTAIAEKYGKTNS